MIQAHRGSGKPYMDFQACTEIDLGSIVDDPLTPEDIAHARENCPAIKWDVEKTLPNGTVIRATKGAVMISTPLRPDTEGWKP